MYAVVVARRLCLCLCHLWLVLHVQLWYERQVEWREVPSGYRYVRGRKAWREESWLWYCSALMAGWVTVWYVGAVWLLACDNRPRPCALMKTKDAERLAEEITKMMRTYDLPAPMRLSQLIEHCAKLWETEDGYD